MCGIAGLLSNDGIKSQWLTEATLEAMATELAHRGTDVGGVWLNAANVIGLAHRRLAILDLSVAGAQSMLSTDGRFVLVYNGEVSNHLDLRDELSTSVGGIDWRRHSNSKLRHCDVTIELPNSIEIGDACLCQRSQLHFVTKKYLYLKNQNDMCGNDDLDKTGAHNSQ